MRSRNTPWIAAATFALLASVALVRVFAQTDPPDRSDEREQRETVPAPSHLTRQHGQVVITLDARTEKASGISAAPLAAARRRKRTTSAAVVLDIEDLVNREQKYAAGRAALRKAQDNLRVTRREYERLKKLYADHQNASAKDLEAAQGRFENQQTDVAAVQRNLALQAAAVRQRWGNAVAQWVAGDTPELERLFRRQDLLVQITLPSGAISSAPATAQLELPGGGRVEARRVGAFPRVDPRLQGLSFLYRTAARPGLEPGLNVTAHLAAGPRVAGVVIPSSAVVWWQGEAWAYVETAAHHFTRRAVPTDEPVADGYFVSQGFAPGERVVSAGAQALLTEEFRSDLQPED